jgi:hypothetical protein
VSDYTDRVRAFAQLNPDQYVPDTEYPLVFQAVARQIEADKALGERVMHDLTLGENARDVLRSPTELQVPDRERYADSRMAAVTWRARAAQQAAGDGDLPDWARWHEVPAEPTQAHQRLGEHPAEPPTARDREGVER